MYIYVYDIGRHPRSNNHRQGGVGRSCPNLKPGTAHVYRMDGARNG